MRATSYSEFRKNLAANLDKVNDDREPVIITRDRGKPSAVLMSLEAYASLDETTYLLSSPRNAERLREAIAELKQAVALNENSSSESTFAETGWEDYLHWQAEDRKILERLNTLIKDCKRSPFDGIGKPEPLRGNWSGWWSRRITEEHRLVYRVHEGTLLIAQCRFHY